MPGLGEYNNISMSEHGSSRSPQVRAEEALRGILPPRTVSKEDVEMAEQLVDHSQGFRDSNDDRSHKSDRNGGNSTSAAYELHRGSSPLGTGASSEIKRHLTPRSDREPSERADINDGYRPRAIQGPETTPEGQICRYL
jgi:hypothetical protein